MKSFVRRVLGRDSAGAGPPYEYLLSAPRYEEVTVRLLDADFRVADPLSFYWNYREIFVQEIYKFRSQKASPFIVDCGANYGTSITYFKNVFPSARIVGVEADPAVFEILDWNIRTRNLGDVRLLNRAVSATRDPVIFHTEGADGGRVHQLAGSSGSVRVDGVRLDDLIQEEVDFLKIDIEGAETEALAACTKLDQVSQLFIEYHSFQDSEQTLTDLLAMLARHGFRYYIHTEFCSPRPFTEEKVRAGMDMQLNVFAIRRPDVDDGRTPG